MTDAELRALLVDCLRVWGVGGRVEAGDANTVRVIFGTERFVLQRAGGEEYPARWLLRTPLREAAGRGPRTAASVTSALRALRTALAAEATD